MTGDYLRLNDLEAKWGRAWRIWRGRRADDTGDERTGGWIATRIDPAAGPYPTVMTDTPDQLDEALVEQLDMAARGVRQLDPAEMGPE